MGVVLEEREVAAELARRRAGGERIVLTNGVFNLLHVGHLRYLRQARALGDVLVVGVNSDASASALKPGRPLVPEAERAELVAALDPVGYAVVFADRTADRLIASLRPAVYAKGGDYSEATLPEMATARAVGARVAFLPLVTDRSTTALLKSMQGPPQD